MVRAACVAVSWRWIVNQAGLAHSDVPKVVPFAIFRLIYRSRSLIPAASHDAEFGNILRSARSNNASKDITGALLSYDNWFAQALEGEESAVRGLFAHICKDKRHDTVEVYEEGPVASRVFSRWAMAIVGEHGEHDIPLVATAKGIAEGAEHHSTPDQERVLGLMRDATRGYGRGS